MDKTVTAAELIASARSLVGSPFIHQGRTANGVDCIGLVSAAFENVSGVGLADFLKYDDVTAYSREPTALLYETTKATCVPIYKLVPGAVMLFRIHRAKYPHHFALYTEKNTMIHADALRAKAVVEQVYGEPWSRWLHSMWKFPGVEYAK